MCANKVVPETAGARFVVSEKGDILSPNTAPETTAPAVTAGGIPILIPIPTIATPRVPAVVQELPVEIPTSEQTIRHETRKNLGDKILSP